MVGPEQDKAHRADEGEASRDEAERITEQTAETSTSDPERAEKGPETSSDLVGKPVAHDPTSKGSKPAK